MKNNSCRQSASSVAMAIAPYIDREWKSMYKHGLLLTKFIGSKKRSF